MAILHEIPEATPTPKPWEDEELSVRQALRLFASHTLEEQARMRGMLGLELQGVHTALDDGDSRLARIEAAVVSLGRAVRQVAEREQVTGSYLIQVAGMAGEAKGAAHAAHRKSLPPILRTLNWLGERVADHWITHLVTLAMGGGVAWLLHWRHLLP